MILQTTKMILTTTKSEQGSAALTAELWFAF